ncbi:MAG TPA: DNA repair protein RecN [Methylomirabilota bacterium]|nr:DNA repair protein RecN [Methylomirabilota bacterium]
MLRALRIKNFAVIETVTVGFQPGLNVLTGETGAGKSIVVDAILLICGGRAQSDVIRADADVATVEAVFDTAGDPGLGATLEAAGLRLDDEQLVVRRELSRSGRHRAFVNDSPVTVGLLERLGQELVQVHGQHEHQRLLEPAAQLDLLDRYAGAEPARAEVAGLFEAYRAALGEVQELSTAERDRAQRQDLLRFQLSELDGARLRAGEEDELRAERRRLQHAERLVKGLAETVALIVEDHDAATGRVVRAARLLRDLGRVDPALSSPADLLEAAVVQLEDAMLAVRALRQRAEAEPGRLEAIEDRLDALARLKRKYGDTEEALLAVRDGVAGELEGLERYEEVLAAAEGRLAEARARLVAAAGTLSQVRTSAGTRLGGLVQRELRALGMDRARFAIAVVRGREDQVTARGLDRVEFEFSANPGEDPRPLARIASGGELSRTMLALHAVIAGAERVPTMIFDEIDAGIGGQMAAVVADKLAVAARGRQVLCVTHLPQIAARAAHHLGVVKAVRAGRSRAAVHVLTGSDRVEEIARMLGGTAPSGTVRRHARELLGARPV